MRVKAIGNGIWNNAFKDRGDVFEIPDESWFSPLWMEILEPPRVEAPPEAPPAAEPVVEAPLVEKTLAVVMIADAPLSAPPTWTERIKRVIRR